jgi:FAD/FMN-containing dehydrogenase
VAVAAGVVTSCTYAAHPFPAAGAVGLFVTIELLQGAASFRVLIDGWLSFVEQLSDPARSAGVVIGGYYIPVLDAPQGTHELVSFLLGVNGTAAQAAAAITPVLAWVAAQPAHLSVIGNVVQSFVSLMAFHEAYDSGSEATGNAGTIGSRLLLAAALRNATTRAQLADALTTITFTMGITGQLVAGGAVRANDPASRETSITPAWRAAGTHVSFGASGPLNTSAATRDAVFASVSSLTGLLRNATPGSGAYWSESDFDEPDWMDAFWGANVPRLQGIKAAVDPRGIITCHHCLAA